MIRTGTPHLWFQQAALVDNVLLERSAFRTKRAAIDRVIGITFNMYYLGYRVLGFVAERMNDHATAN